MNCSELRNLFVKSNESDEDVSTIVIVGDLSGPVPDLYLFSVVRASFYNRVSDLSSRVPNVDVSCSVRAAIWHVAHNLVVASHRRG